MGLDSILLFERLLQECSVEGKNAFRFCRKCFNEKSRFRFVVCVSLTGVIGRVSRISRSIPGDETRARCVRLTGSGVGKWCTCVALINDGEMRKAMLQDQLRSTQQCEV